MRQALPMLLVLVYSGAAGILHAGEPLPRVAALIAKLNDDREIVREAAVESLARIGEPAVAALIDVLTKGPSRAKRHAADVLATFGPAGKAAVPALRSLLLDRDNDFPTAAADALVSIGPESIPALIDGLNDKRVLVRRAVAQELERTQIDDKDIVSALAGLLEDEDSRNREVAVLALVRLGASAKLATPQLQKSITERNTFVRSWAIQVLGGFGVKLHPLLIKAMANDDPTVRLEVAAHMVRVGLEMDAAEAVLKGLTENKDKAIRFAARSALVDLERRRQALKLAALLKDGFNEPALREISAIGWNAKAAAPAIVKFLDANKAEHRLHAATTLLNTSGDSTLIVPALGKMLAREDNLSARITCVEALWQHGAAAAPLLIQLATDPKHKEIRPTILRSISILTDINGGDWAKIVPALAPAMKTEDVELRRAAMEAMGAVGTSATPTLVEGLKDDDAKVRELAVKGLGRHRVADRKTIELMLKTALRDKDVGPRYHAIESLTLIGDKGIRPFVAAIKDHKRNETWGPFVQLLSIHGVKSPTALAFLLEAVKLPENHLRGAAAVALARYGEAAKDAVPDLTKILADGDPHAKNLAIRALCAIGPAGHPAAAEALVVRDSAYRLHILSHLHKHDCRSKAAVTWVAFCFEDKSAPVRRLAAELLGAIGPDAAEALRELDVALDDSDPDVRRAVAEAIGRIKRAGK